MLRAIFKCLDPIAILAAASTLREPFVSPPERATKKCGQRKICWKIS